eukprot:13172961-Heterocapsa_arctica.AAC.1
MAREGCGHELLEQPRRLSQAIQRLTESPKPPRLAVRGRRDDEDLRVARKSSMEKCCADVS